MTSTVNWIFGRGLSIGCNLKWQFPAEWADLPREDIIKNIKVDLEKEMRSENVTKASIFDLFSNLAKRTNESWRHRLITTNWDYLIQESISEMKFKKLPRWLCDSHVSHVNGSIEDFGNKDLRSPFILERDSFDERKPSYEADDIFNKMLWGNIFCVVGMSFECESDRFLLHSLNRHEDNVPIGESTWFVLNPCKSDLDISSRRIKDALPNARVYKAPITLDQWIERGTQGLVSLGAFAF
jgi:hypothetical protein